MIGTALIGTVGRARLPAVGVRHAERRRIVGVRRAGVGGAEAFVSKLVVDLGAKDVLIEQAQGDAEGAEQKRDGDGVPKGKRGPKRDPPLHEAPSGVRST